MKNGGIIGPKIFPAWNSPASGVWDIKEVVEYRKQGRWPGAWSFQRPITITQTNVANLQVRVQLTSTNFDYSKCRSDGSDIRFTVASNADVTTSALTYWTETWVQNGTSVFWVLVPTSGTSTIHVRYGNNNVTASASNIDTTMEAGMRYRYYDGTAFNTLFAGGTTGAPNTNWGSGTVLIDGVGNQSDTLSIIWDGWVKPSGSGNHTFFGTSDDGQRLYIPIATRIIDNWVDQGPTERSAVVSITDGAPRSIMYEWYENGGGAAALLGWQPPSGAKVYPIPSTSLRSPKYSSNYIDPYSHTGTIGTEQIV